MNTRIVVPFEVLTSWKEVLIFILRREGKGREKEEMEG